MYHFKSKVIFRILIRVFLAFWISISHLPVSANSPTIIFSKSQTTIAGALEEITKQSGYGIAINHQHLDVNKEIQLTRSEFSLKEALDKILGKTGNRYHIEGRYILIYRDKKPVVATLRKEEVDEIFVFEEPLLDDPQRGLSNDGVDTVNEPSRLIGDNRTPTFYLESRGTKERLSDKGSSLAFKTNLLYGAATITPNLGFEFGLGRRFTLDLAVGYNPWNRKGTIEDNKKFVHWLVHSELRYWFCERFNGHFIGIHALGSKFNISEYKVPLMFDRNSRNEGWGVGGGVSYGYNLPLGLRWGLEFNVGVGMAYLEYKKYACDWCDDSSVRKTKTYFGPTRAGVTLTFIIK